MYGDGVVTGVPLVVIVEDDGELLVVMLGTTVWLPEMVTVLMGGMVSHSLVLTQT